MGQGTTGWAEGEGQRGGGRRAEGWNGVRWVRRGEESRPRGAGAAKRAEERDCEGEGEQLHRRRRHQAAARGRSARCSPHRPQAPAACPRSPSPRAATPPPLPALPRGGRGARRRARRGLFSATPRPCVRAAGASGAHETHPPSRLREHRSLPKLARRERRGARRQRGEGGRRMRLAVSLEGRGRQREQV